MHAEQLEVVARIVAKCKSGFYQIERVKLEAVLPAGGMNGYTPGDTPREYMDLALGAFSVDTLPQFWTFRPPHSQPAPSESPSIFQKLSLAENLLTPIYFSEHFSTLRYGCSLDEDLAHYRRFRQLPEQIEIDMWRWLAFGLFYPRPKRFAQKFKLRNLGNLTFGPTAIRAIVDTLRNPAAQLVDNDIEGKDTSTTDCLMVCTLTTGAEIDVFVSGVEYDLTDSIYRRRETWTKTLLETCEFEALCERDDGSVCVVVPGAGLGWVSQRFVAFIEREPLDEGRSAHDGLYHATLRLGPCRAQFDELRSLIEAIGRQLRSLTFDYDVQTRDMYPPHTFTTAPSKGVVMELIRDHCVNLQHLQLAKAPAEDITVLLDALAGRELGGRLLSLKVNGCVQTFDEEAIVRLMSILGDTANPPALQELRLDTYWIGPLGLASTHGALLANRTLEMVELRRFSPSTADHLKDLQSRLDEAFQGQLLRSRSPMDAKLAFLSTVDAKHTASINDAATAARCSLDQSSLHRIFEFAASVETRRVIAWCEDFQHIY